MKNNKVRLTITTSYKDQYDRDKIITQTKKEDWTKEEYFCPECGQKSVWCRIENSGDYYVGETYLCVNCDTYFYLPSGNIDAKSSYKEQLTQLKNLTESNNE